MNSRAKGLRGERDLADRYRAAGYPAARIPNSGGLDQKGDLAGVPGAHVEVKSGASVQIWKALEQAEDEAAAGDMPAVHFRRCSPSRTPGANTGFFVAVPLDDFIALLQARDR